MEHASTRRIRGQGRDLEILTIGIEKPAAAVPVMYAAESNPGLVSFTIRFTEETVLVGYPKAHLWVEGQGADDMDLFLLVQKLDANGSAGSSSPRSTTVRCCRTSPSKARRCCATRVPMVGCGYPHAIWTRSCRRIPCRPTPSTGSRSWRRVRSDVEIDLLPIGLMFYPGQQLRFVISAHNLVGAHMPGIRDYLPQNRGSTSFTRVGRTRRIYSCRSRHIDEERSLAAAPARMPTSTTPTARLASWGRVDDMPMGQSDATFIT
jgi:hypothetical protein